MKKLLIVLISLLTCLALTLTISAVVILSGRKDHKTPQETQAISEVTESEEVTTEPPATEAPTVAPVTEATTVPTVSHVEPETTKPTEEPDKIFPGVTFRPVDRTVYASQDVNVREGPAVADYKVVGKLKLGESVQQVAIGDNGWSRVIFQNKKCYIASKYLRTEKPQYGGSVTEETHSQENYPAIKSVHDTMYSTGSVNVRSGPGKGYKAIGYLKHGQEAERVGIADNGWSKIRYNNGYGFVSNAFLSSDKPPKETKWQNVDQTVYATETLNLRTGPGVNHKKAAELKPGESVQRTAIGDNGWSELYYQGSRLYASSQYLTQEAPADTQKPSENTKPSEPAMPTEPQQPRPTCKEVNDYMVAAETLILHAGPGPKYEKMGQLTKGSLVHRTGICSNGWSQILLKEKKVYVVSAYLEEEKKPASPSQPEPANPTDPKTEAGYTENKAKVYTSGDDVHVRTGPGTDHKSLGKLSKGTMLNRLAIGDDGWTKVEYKDQKAYIKSTFLSEEAPVIPGNGSQLPSSSKASYKEVNETVYSIDSVFVRTAPNTEAESLGNLYFGDSIQRIGIGDNGWSKVVWDKKTAYAYSKFLSTEKPEIPDFGETTTPGFPTPNSPFIYQYWDEEGQIPYAMFEPVSAGSDPLPLIISLHGSAEVGQNREFMEQQHLTKVMREWEYTKLDPINAYVVCPHIGKGVSFNRWGTPQGADAVFKLIDHLKENYNIDETKIILEGHSMGGQGAMYLAADDRACFSKLVVVSGEYANIDYDRIQIPVFGCVGGGMNDPEGQRDAEGIRKFMTTTFKDKFKDAEFYEGPYNHDNVAIRFFQKDEDKNNQSDIIEWMLNDN